MKTEPVVSHEVEPRPDTLGHVLLVRHGDYHNPYIDNSNNPGYDPERAGWLNEKGIAQADEFAENLFEELSNKPVDILILNSPTPVVADDGERLGRRAEHTALEIGNKLRELKLGDPISRMRFLGGTAEVGGSAAEPLFDDRAQEPQTHYIASSDTPTAYMDALVDKYGFGGRKEAYHVGDPDLDTVAREIGAETAEDVADRTRLFLADCRKIAEQHAEHQPDRELIIIATTHDDNLRVATQRVFDYGEKAHGKFAHNLEALDISLLRDGSMQTTVEGEEHVAHI